MIMQFFHKSILVLSFFFLFLFLFFFFWNIRSFSNLLLRFYFQMLQFQSRLFLVNNCLVEGDIKQEFVHALGFFHEQSRSDRDTVIQVFLGTVQSSKLSSLPLSYLLHFTSCLVCHYHIYLHFIILFNFS